MLRLGLDRFAGKVLSLCISISICCHKGVFPEGLSRTVSRPNGGSCASIGLAGIANKQRYPTARRCPKRKATPQIETGRVL